jgi:hypothetical protein
MKNTIQNRVHDAIDMELLKEWKHLVDRLAICNAEIAFENIEKEKRASELEVAEIEIYQASLHAFHHILNNLLNQLLLIRMAAFRSKDFPPKTLTYFDVMTAEASNLLSRLSKVEKVSRENIIASVQP